MALRWFEFPPFRKPCKRGFTCARTLIFGPGTRENLIRRFYKQYYGALRERVGPQLLDFIRGIQFSGIYLLQSSRYGIRNFLGQMGFPIAGISVEKNSRRG